MPLYVPRQMPRQIADAVVQAVMDAAIETHGNEPSVQQEALRQAVLDALASVGIELVAIEGVPNGQEES